MLNISVLSHWLSEGVLHDLALWGHLELLGQDGDSLLLVQLESLHFLEVLHLGGFLGLLLHLSRNWGLGLSGGDEVFLDLVPGSHLLQHGHSVLGGLKSSASSSGFGRLLFHFVNDSSEVRWLLGLLIILLLEKASPLVRWLVVHSMDCVFNVLLLIEVVDVFWVDI